MSAAEAGPVQSFGPADMSVAWMLGGDGLPSGIDPEQPAIVWESGSRTYAELRSNALAVARALRERDLRPGDRVACLLFNRGEIFELYFACAYAGLTFVPLNFRLTPSELRTVLRDSGARLVFTEPETSPLVRQATAGSDAPTAVVELASAAGGQEYDDMAASAPIEGPFEVADPHLILFSSGTTGKPKGVCLTHRNIMSYAMLQATIVPRLGERMVSLVVPPMFNTAGINELSTGTLFVGGTLAILPSRGWSARRMAGYIERWQATHAIVFPTMITPMLEADAEDPLPLESLRYASFGGEQTPAVLMARFRARWPQVVRDIGYGLTEGGLITFADDRDIDERPGSVGRACPYQTLKIAGPHGEPLPTGEVGEVWTASDFVTPGYWNAPELTAAAIVDGWLRTGDLGRLDEDGYLYIEGRVRDMIISKGQNVYPAEIEGVLLQHPAVLECAVIGVPDDEYGEAVCAVLVLRAGAELSDEECGTYVASRIASYKKPRYVMYRDVLPLSDNNKVLKRDLVADVTAQLAGGRRPRS